MRNPVSIQKRIDDLDKQIRRYDQMLASTERRIKENWSLIRWFEYVIVGLALVVVGSVVFLFVNFWPF